MVTLNNSSITTYTVSAAKATATPIQVKGKCLFGFDGQIQLMLERNAPATQEFTLIQTSGAGGPTLQIDFGSFGRTVYVYAGAPLALSLWMNTEGLN